MKGHERIIEMLNARLIEELTGISQYSAHRSRVAILEYPALVAYLEERIADETRHYNLLLDRIIFLGGEPVEGKLNEVHVGQDVQQMHVNDRATESNAVRVYNESINLCIELRDAGTRAMLETILADEEDHLRDLDAQLAQIEQMTLANYLSAKLV